MIGGTLLRFFRTVGPASMSLTARKDNLLASHDISNISVATGGSLAHKYSHYY